MERLRAHISCCIFLFFIVTGTSWALDKRTEAIDAYIFIDTSASMSPVLDSAGEWLCTAVVDGLLQEGDHLTLWSFSDRPTRILDVTIAADSKDAIRKSIKSVKADTKSANYLLALREASRAEAARPNRKAIAYVLVASTLTDGNPHNGELGDLLRYSKMEAHPGWKNLIVGLGDIRSRAQSAAASYLADQNLAPRQ